MHSALLDANETPDRVLLSVCMRLRVLDAIQTVTACSLPYRGSSLVL